MSLNVQTNPIPKQRCDNQTGPNKDIIDSFSQFFTPPSVKGSKAETATKKFLEVRRLGELGKKSRQMARTAMLCSAG